MQLQEIVHDAKSLYDRDYLLWTEDTVKKLKNRDFDGLDIENLIEEIEDLGRSQRQQLENRLDVLFMHLLKRCYVNMPDCDRGWEETIREQRRAMKRQIASSPSLKRHFEDICDEVFRDSLEDVRKSYPQYEFPDTWQFSRDRGLLLNVDLWE